MSATPKKDRDHVRALVDELAWLKDHAQRRPSSWAYGRIAAIEGLLAAHREAVAWVEAQAIIAAFRRG